PPAVGRGVGPAVQPRAGRPRRGPVRGGQPRRPDCGRRGGGGRPGGGPRPAGGAGAGARPRGQPPPPPRALAPPPAAPPGGAPPREGVRVWDLLTGEEVAALRGPNPGADIGPVAFSPDGKLLACGSSDRAFNLWEVPAGGKGWKPREVTPDLKGGRASGT